MALIRPVPPLNITTALANNIGRFRRPGDPSVPILLDPTAERYALPVYVLTLGDLLASTGLAAARPVGWRFLAKGLRFGSYMADVRETLPGAKPVLSSLSRGPQVEAAILYARDIGAIGPVQANNYQLRQLSTAPILIESYWLKSLDGGEDLIVPFNTLNSALDAMQLRTTADFFTAAQTIAAQFKPFDV